MRKIVLTGFGIFITVFISYFILTIGGKGVIPHDLDYFNPLAKSFLAGRLDIPNPIVTNDLTFYKGKWYLYYGPIPALLLIPFQLIKGRFIPAAYLGITFAALDAVVVWLILKRLEISYLKEKVKFWSEAVVLIFFVFGTNLVYLGTRSGVWFVSQTVSFLGPATGLWILLKKELTVKDYFIASVLIASSFFNRTVMLLMMTLAVLRVADDYWFQKESRNKIFRKLAAVVFPIVLFGTLFGLYNFARFGSPLETGVTYQDTSYYHFLKYAPQGFFSLTYLPRNFWLMFLQLPKISISNVGISFLVNPEGMSIFFVSPLFLAAFLTIRNLWQNKGGVEVRMVRYLWLTFLALLIPSLVYLNANYWEFGSRYAFDFSLILLVLAVLGLRGKVGTGSVLATAMAVILNLYSVLWWGK